MLFFYRCVVWTGDGRVFFYNPSSRTSVWERPEELAGRSDVDKLVSSPPEAAIEAGVKREASNDAETSLSKKQKVEQPQPQPKRKLNALKFNVVNNSFYSMYRLYGLCW